MAIVPHVSPARRRARIYPGELSRMSVVRADLRADLSGFDEDLVETATLCASEMVANAIEHTRSGTDPDGRVLRALFTPEPGVLRLAVVDDGALDSAPRTPGRRSEDRATVERGRGLLMVEALSLRWGTYPVVPFPFCADLGTTVWAEFSLGGGER